MKTTAEERTALRRYVEDGMMPHIMPGFLVNLLDDFAAMEAELAAFRRIEWSELELEVERNSARIEARRWRIFDQDRMFGFGSTLAEALADYDAKKSLT